METKSIEASPFINQNKAANPTSPDSRNNFGPNPSRLIYYMGTTRPRLLLDRCFNSLSYAKI